MYTCYLAPCQIQLLLGRYDLELLGAVSEQVGIGLGDGLPLVGLLDKVLVALLISELDSVLLGFKLYPVAVHEVGRRLPAHERVLPSVALGQNVPVH
jgi:hypothetical protein